MSVVIPFPRTSARLPDGGAGLAPLVPLHVAVAAARRRHRSLGTAAGRWALARGLPLPADHVALWAAAAERSGCYGDVGGLTGPWYASELDSFLSTTVDWCAAAGCPVPTDLPRSLGYLFGFLADTGRLHPASDPVTDLCAALVGLPRSHHRTIPPPPVPGPAAA